MSEDTETVPPDNSDELERLDDRLEESEAQVQGSPDPEDAPAHRPDFRRIYGGAKVPYPGSPEEALRPANEDLAEDDEEE